MAAAVVSIAPCAGLGPAAGSAWAGAPGSGGSGVSGMAAMCIVRLMTAGALAPVVSSSWWSTSIGVVEGPAPAAATDSGQIGCECHTGLENKE